MSARNKPYVLGLTGGVGCGKSTAASRLKELGAVLIDADAISRSLSSPGGEALPAIRESFGDGVFLEDGSLDRAALGALVFSDEQKRRALEGIMHPAIQRVMMEQLDKYRREEMPVVVMDVPLLYECALDALCDEVWVISAEREQQVLRIMNRDGLNREAALARIDSQLPLSEKEARADRVIRTGRPLPEVLKELEHLYRELLKANGEGA